MRLENFGMNKAQEIINVFSEERDYYYHGSGKEMSIGTVYTSKKRSSGTFGDWEKLIEQFRPSNVNVSRLSSFFMVKRPSLVDFAGGTTLYIYRVIPLSEVVKLYFSWLSKLMEDLSEYIIGFGKTSSYKVDINSILKNFEDLSLARRYVENYYFGKQLYDSSTTVEYLCNKIKVDKLYE